MDWDQGKTLETETERRPASFPDPSPLTQAKGKKYAVVSRVQEISTFSSFWFYLSLLITIFFSHGYIIKWNCCIPGRPYTRSLDSITVTWKLWYPSSKHQAADQNLLWMKLSIEWAQAHLSLDGRETRLAGGEQASLALKTLRTLDVHSFRMGSDIAPHNNKDNKKSAKKPPLCAWHGAKHLSCIILFNPHNIIRRELLLLL